MTVPADKQAAAIRYLKMACDPRRLAKAAETFRSAHKAELSDACEEAERALEGASLGERQAQARAQPAAPASDVREALRDTLNMLKAAHIQLGMRHEDNPRVIKARAALAQASNGSTALTAKENSP